MKDDHVAALVEDLDSKFDAVTELVTGVAADVQSLATDVRSIDQRLEHIERDIAVITAAVTDQSQQVRRHELLLGDHETRLSAQESAA